MITHCYSNKIRAKYLNIISNCLTLKASAWYIHHFLLTIKVNAWLPLLLTLKASGLLTLIFTLNLVSGTADVYIKKLVNGYFFLSMHIPVSNMTTVDHNSPDNESDLAGQLS